MWGLTVGTDFQRTTTKAKIESQSHRIDTEYISCHFRGYMKKDATPVRIKAQEIPQGDSFQNLGSIISKDREIKENVEHRIREAWLKWRPASSIVYDRHVPTKNEKKILQDSD